MYHLLGPERCQNRMRKLVELTTGRDMRAASQRELKAGYMAFLRRRQPDLPSHDDPGVCFLDDQAQEDAFIRAFLRPSPLDDLERYADQGYFQNGPHVREAIREDLAHVHHALVDFHRTDPGFWDAFALFVTHLFCPQSQYSRGGSDSGAIGAIFLSGPRSYSRADLYELLVHEFTHTAMFVDELITPHYEDEEAMARPENFALGAITGLWRPLDKTLHSVTVATEVLLHRQRNLALGRDISPRTVHPETPRLSLGILRAVDSMRYPPRVAALLSERAHQLLELCGAVAEAALRKEARAPGALGLRAV
jgi:hypothetical protein